MDGRSGWGHSEGRGLLGIAGYHTACSYPECTKCGFTDTLNTEDNLQGTVPVPYPILIWSTTVGADDTGPGGSLGLGWALCLPSSSALGPQASGERQSLLPAAWRPPRVGKEDTTALCTHVINFWLRHRNPLVDSQGCVANSHPFLLPAGNEEEPVTRGLWTGLC